MSEPITIPELEIPGQPGDEDDKAPTCPSFSMLNMFLNYYGEIAEKMMNDKSILDRNKKEIMEQFDLYNLTGEEKAKYISEMFIKTINEGQKLASNSAIQIMKQEAETPLKCAQVDLVKRQQQGYDDSLLIKIMEQQGGLASFAVNSDSDYAQDAINDLRAKMGQVQTRSQPIPSEVVPPLPVPIVSTPQNLTVSNMTDVSFTVTWNSVTDATSYQLFADGVEVYSGGALIFDVVGLTQLTKYAFNVTAWNNGNASKLSQTVVGTTIATPIP